VPPFELYCPRGGWLGWNNPQTDHLAWARHLSAKFPGDGPMGLIVTSRNQIANLAEFGSRPVPVVPQPGHIVVLLGQCRDGVAADPSLRDESEQLGHSRLT
jgi:hypothetical protein